MIVYSLEPTADGPLFNITGVDLNSNGNLTPGQIYSIFVRRTDTTTGAAVILPFTVVVTDFTVAPNDQNWVLLLT
jgi:hypothetical protein